MFPFSDYFGKLGQELKQNQGDKIKLNIQYLAL